MGLANNFEPLRTEDSDLTRVQDRVRHAFAVTLDQIDRAINNAVAAAEAAVWSTVSVPFHDDMRRIKGDKDGKTGPRALIVAGGTAYFDGGQGVYAWDPTSSGIDNDTTIIGKFTTQGRWRKV